MPQSKKKMVASKQSHQFEVLAKKTENTIRSAENALHLEDPLSPHDQRSARALLRVKPEAIAVAIDLAERHPDRFADFDTDGAKKALSYEVAMTPLVRQLRDMADRIENSVVQRKTKAVEHTFALYGSAKSLVRVAKGESMAPQVGSLGTLLRTRRSRRRNAKGTSPVASPSPVTGGVSASSTSPTPSDPVASPKANGASSTITNGVTPLLNGAASSVNGGSEGAGHFVLIK